MWNWNIENFGSVFYLKKLLIEPCGIEIKERYNHSEQSGILLIEPCGIEINEKDGVEWDISGF